MPSPSGPSDWCFFLGGWDAEMCTIRDLLQQHGLAFFDKHLRWGACLSVYAEELGSLGETRPVLVELALDMPVPSAAVVIDHHGPLAGRDRPTSLEQVAALLGLHLDRRQRLIAANDRGHRRAMRALGATAEEVEEIRRYDRLCQGVTPAAEAEALRLAHQFRVRQGLNVIKIEQAFVSPIADRLQDLCDALLVISPEGVHYYGSGAAVEALNRKFPGGWYGGDLPDNGFWGHAVTERVRAGKVIRFLEPDHPAGRIAH